MSSSPQDAPVLSVTQLTNAIKHNLESSFPSIWLQGEISNAKLHTSGHFYFSLKDTNSQIGAVMFRANFSSLKRAPKDGDQVVVKGGINVYPPSGRYQIVVQEIRQVGVGELLQKLEELKHKLMKKGWFKQEYKKPLPQFPKRIGVITSPTGAAIQDMLNVLTRRFSGFHLILNPVKVQGPGAAEEIAEAVRQFNQHQLVDVMIVGRGGGSIEDLWAFNEEVVAEAIFYSKIPVIGAVGHETDHCIAEYVADVRAPTPSAAAEIVMGELALQLEKFDLIRTQMSRTVSHLLRTKRSELNNIIKQPVFNSPFPLLGPWMQKCDEIRQNIDQSMRERVIQTKVLLNAQTKHLSSLNPITRIQLFREKMHNLEKQLNINWERSLSLKKERIKNLINSLQSIDPKKLLSKGYSILFSEKTGSVINSVQKLKEKDNIRILVSDGELTSTIKEVHPHD